MEEKVKPQRSAAKKKADERYQRKKLSQGIRKRILLEVKPKDFDMIADFTKTVGISRTQAILHAVKYCMENDVKFIDAMPTDTDTTPTDTTDE